MCIDVVISKGRGCSAVEARWTQDFKIPGSNPVSSRLPHWGRKIRCAGLQSLRKTFVVIKKGR